MTISGNNVEKIARFYDEIEKDIGYDENLVKAIAIGSMKWFNLSRDPKRSATFDWDSILNINANSGLYSQYAHARICSVLEKVPKVKNFENLLLTNDLCPIRDTNKESRRTRTIISMATNQVLENGLKLLGIKAPYTM